MVFLTQESWVGSFGPNRFTRIEWFNGFHLPPHHYRCCTQFHLCSCPSDIFCPKLSERHSSLMEPNTWLVASRQLKHQSRMQLFANRTEMQITGNQFHSEALSLVKAEAPVHLEDRRVDSLTNFVMKRHLWSPLLDASDWICLTDNEKDKTKTKLFLEIARTV